MQTAYIFMALIIGASTVLLSMNAASYDAVIENCEKIYSRDTCIYIYR